MKKKLVLALLAAVMMTTAVGCSGNKEVTPVAQEDVNAKLAEYADPQAILSAAQAKEVMDTQDNVVIFDIRKSGDFKKGHIEGAVNYFRTDYESEAYEFGGMAVERDGFAKLLGESGATKDSMILVYGNDQNLDSARFAWMLQMYGHHNVALIEGGYPGWLAAGFEGTKEDTVVEAQTFEFANEMDASILATLEEVKAAVENPSGDVIILDTRADDEYSGASKKSGAFRKGRIPGSIHIEYTNAIGEHGFKSKEELQKLYEDAGVTPDKTIIAYCQSGVRSANTTYVLREILGYENVKNYDGSWIEWSFYEELPIEQD